MLTILLILLVHQVQPKLAEKSEKQQENNQLLHSHILAGKIKFYMMWWQQFSHMKMMIIAHSAMGALAYVTDSRGKVHTPPEK